MNFKLTCRAKQHDNFLNGYELMREKYIILDLEGLQLTPVEREMLLHPSVGGVILFSRNYENCEQLKDLILNIKNIQKNLFVAVDQEGGRVQRLRDGFTALPAFADLGQLYDQNPKLALREVDKFASIMANELRAVGIDFSFSPVLDLRWGVSDVIGSRSFHENPKVVAELANRYLQALKRNNMIAVAKHFPGHGGVKPDSHLEKVIDDREKSVILENDLYPFRQAIINGVDAVMTAHVIYSKFDDKPATFSKFWLKGVLRDQLGFRGTVFSDDLSMFAAEMVGDMKERVAMALEVGCDKVLVCNNRKGVMEILNFEF